MIRASVAKLCALYCKYFLLFGAKSLKVHQMIIIRTLYLLQVSGSDLLFISKSHNKKRSRSSSFCYIKLLSYTKPVLFNIMLLYVKSIPYMILT